MEHGFGAVPLGCCPGGTDPEVIYLLGCPGAGDHGLLRSCEPAGQVSHYPRLSVPSQPSRRAAEELGSPACDQAGC